MSIPEDEIMKHLDFLLEQGDPDSPMHYMHVVAAKPGGVGPLGLPVEGELGTSVYAMAFDLDSGGGPEEWITKTIVRARGEHGFPSSRSSSVRAAGYRGPAFPTSPACTNGG